MPDIKWSQWDENGLWRCGTMPLAEAIEWTSRFEKEAEKVIIEEEADHVVYCRRILDDNGNNVEIRWYMKPMTDDEFCKTMAGVKNSIVYAIHKRGV